MTSQGLSSGSVWACQFELDIADPGYPKGFAVTRFPNVVIAVVVLICHAPVMLVIGVAIWLQGGGAPVLWALAGWQRRKAFPMLEISQYGY